MQTSPLPATVHRAAWKDTIQKVSEDIAEAAFTPFPNRRPQNQCVHSFLSDGLQAMPAEPEMEPEQEPDEDMPRLLSTCQFAEVLVAARLAACF